MKTEIFIEGQPLDLMDNLPTEFTYAIDDIQDFGSKNTSFSKTLNIAGSANNNKIFGFVFDLGNANFTNDAIPNVGYNFNATKAAQCRIFVDGIQVFKGILRLLEMVRTGEVIDYQCSVFGELGGFITALANKKLEELDFSNYDMVWNQSTITGSWDNVSGGSVYFPLIDSGVVSTNKIDFDFKAFKPALYVKEYIEKIVTNSGYTSDFPLLDTNFFKRLIIPNNQKEIVSADQTTALEADYTVDTTVVFNNFPSLGLEMTTITLGNFVLEGANTAYRYNNGTPIIGTITANVVGNMDAGVNIPRTFFIRLKKNGTTIAEETINMVANPTNFNVNLTASNVTFNLNDILLTTIDNGSGTINITDGTLTYTSDSNTLVPVQYNETININQTIPKGIFQRDFFLSICKMFNLYVYEDQWDSKKIIIKPYIDFYDGSFIDWSNKIDRSKPIGIKPMSEINARYFQFKYKDDNDFYNENYKKKFNEGYSDLIYDNELDFVKNTATTDIIFAGSPLFQYPSTDKIYPAIYKKSDNNTKEDKMDFVIRIMQGKKIIDRNSWKIKNGVTDLVTLTSYGYAGHLDDPFTPTNDINFGAPKEIFFTLTTYPTTNLFNAYYSDYMAEITDKDSKLLKCEALLNIADIQNLDFSKLIMIDNQLFRLNKVDGYSIIDYKTSKVELLKVITKVF
jgi:hypothetical protein